MITLFASIDDVALPKWDLFLKVRICSERKQGSFHYELAPM